MTKTIADEIAARTITLSDGSTSVVIEIMDHDIDALRNEALFATPRDEERIALCDRALAGDVEAKIILERALDAKGGTY